jgi:hypothetical protein
VAGALAPLITGYLLGDGHDYTAAIVVAGASPLIAVGALLLFVRGDGQKRQAAGADLSR